MSRDSWPPGEWGGAPTQSAGHHHPITTKHHQGGNSDGSTPDRADHGDATRRPSDTAVPVWVEFATAPWFGSCRVCRRELDAELTGHVGRVGGWVCARCLTELVRQYVIAELLGGRRAS